MLAAPRRSPPYSSASPTFGEDTPVETLGMRGFQWGGGPRACAESLGADAGRDEHRTSSDVDWWIQGRRFPLIWTRFGTSRPTALRELFLPTLTPITPRRPTRSVLPWCCRGTATRRALHRRRHARSLGGQRVPPAGADLLHRRHGPGRGQRVHRAGRGLAVRLPGLAAPAPRSWTWRSCARATARTSGTRRRSWTSTSRTGWTGSGACSRRWRRDFALRTSYWTPRGPRCRRRAAPGGAADAGGASGEAAPGRRACRHFPGERRR